MSEHLPEYELYAIRYAMRDAKRSQHFMGGDPHDGPMDMDYFIWVARHRAQVYVIDTGFSPEAAQKRRRAFLCHPAEALRQLDIDPGTVGDVILTHLHYDHAGNFDDFPAARFHIQEPEVHFATGRHIRHRYFSSGYEAEDIVNVVRLNFARRVMLYVGAVDVAPGIRLEPVPGHSPGQQAVCVHTARGWVVIASDAAHYFENVQRHRPYPAACNVVEMIDSFDRLLHLAGDIEHIIPGHDPLVMQVYPPARPGLEGKAARLDTAPAPLPERKPARRAS